MSSLKSKFLLSPDVTYLNHGACGACPKEVFWEYQKFQLDFEQHGCRFMDFSYPEQFHKSREELAAFVNCSPDDLTLIPNVTHGVTTVLRSLMLPSPGEILLTNQRYRAFERLWQESALERVIPVETIVNFPVSSNQEVLENIWSNVNRNTSAIFISHIASPTGLIFPVAELCRKAREQGIVTIIDGAHAPGLIPVDLESIDPDFYIGNCHKWMSAPKGVGFLYAREELQTYLKPLVVSHGQEFPGAVGSPLVDDTLWTGVKDSSAMLSLPALFKFYTENDWSAQQERAHQLAVSCHQSLISMFGNPPLFQPESNFYRQMFAYPLPTDDLDKVKSFLFEKYKIVIGGFPYEDQAWIRPSFAAYNTEEDRDHLLQALADYFSLTH